MSLLWQSVPVDQEDLARWWSTPNLKDRTRVAHANDFRLHIEAYLRHDQPGQLETRLRALIRSDVCDVVHDLCVRWVDG